MIPLEDNFDDIVGNAVRGLGLDLAALRGARVERIAEALHRWRRETPQPIFCGLT
jgi:hypothetical protein